jgi:rhodanese-related sulfurtransferase
MADYVDFATYDAGIILPKQITDEVVNSFAFIDTRTAEEFSEKTIKGARHIEWREVFSRLGEIPKDQPTILFCNTGALSAQAAFGLRVMGYENVLILQTGFDGWQAHRTAFSH